MRLLALACLLAADSAFAAAYSCLATSPNGATETLEVSQERPFVRTDLLSETFDFPIHILTCALTNNNRLHCRQRSWAQYPLGSFMSESSEVTALVTSGAGLAKNLTCQKKEHREKIPVKFPISCKIKTWWENPDVESTPNKGEDLGSIELTEETEDFQNFFSYDATEPFGKQTAACRVYQGKLSCKWDLASTEQPWRSHSVEVTSSEPNAYLQTTDFIYFKGGFSGTTFDHGHIICNGEGKNQ